MQSNLMTTAIYDWQFDSDGEKFAAEMSDEQLLGRGSFGYIFRSCLSKSDEACAVKHIRVSRHAVTKKMCEAEVNIMKTFKKKPYMVQYIGSAYNEKIKTFAIAMELAMCSLDEFMTSDARCINGLPYNIFIDLIEDCTTALDSLFRCNIAHRNIEAKNVLVFFKPSHRIRKSPYLFKMCGFQSSKVDLTRHPGNYNHMHPAIAMNYFRGTKESYTREECDLWSLACCLYFCATNKDAFETVYDAEYCEFANVMVKKPELSKAIGFSVNDEGCTYIEHLENENYPNWFQHCATRMLISMFHSQKFSEFKDLSSALVHNEASTYIVLDAPTRHQIIQYVDLSNIPPYKIDYPKLSDELGCSDPSKNYFVISSNAIIKLEMLRPSNGETYIVMCNDWIIEYLNGDETKLPDWHFDLPELQLTEAEVGEKSYGARCSKIIMAHKALEDVSNMSKLYTGGKSLLEKLCERLGISLYYGTTRDIKLDESPLKRFPEESKLEELDNIPTQNYLENCKAMLSEVQQLRQKLETYSPVHCPNVEMKDFNSLLVDPLFKPQTYDNTEDSCVQLLSLCMKERMIVSLQIQDLLNREHGLFWMILKVMKICRRMQDFNFDFDYFDFRFLH